MISSLDLDDEFDETLGLSWLRKDKSWTIGQHLFVKLPATCSYYDLLMKESLNSQAYKCKEQCDILTCGSVVCTITQYLDIVTHYTAEIAAGSSVEIHAPSKFTTYVIRCF